MAFVNDIHRSKELCWFKYSIFIFSVLIFVLQTIQARATQYEILAFGDSITKGVKIDSDGNKTGILIDPNGARTSDGYEPELEFLYEGSADSAYVYNWGVGGERTDAGLNRIDTVLASRQAQYILIMEGANDILAGISTATTTFNLSQMADRSRGAFVEPILATVSPNTLSEPWASGMNDIIANDLNVKIKQLALSINVVLADQYSFLSPPPDGTGWETIYNSGDGLHLSDEGQIRVAKTWFVALQHFPVGLVSYWTLDEIGGSTFVDSTETNDGQCTDNCPDAIVGIVDGGQYFDGTRSITVASGSSLNWGVNESFSFEFWMRKDIETIENEPVVGRVYESGESQWWVGVGHNVGRGQARFFARDSAGNAFGVSGTTILTDGLWHHVVAVRDAVGSELRIYVDGVLEGITLTSYGSDFVAPNAPMTIGMVELAAGATVDFNGSLDEVAVYNRALSSDEIDAHLEKGYLGLGYFTGSESVPQITSTAPVSVIVGGLYQYDVYAVGSPTPSFVLDNGPSGMVIDPFTGLLEWTPDTTGTYSVKVIAQNTIGSDSQSFTVTVHDQPSFPSELVSYWTLDETGGSKFVDSAGLNDGQCTDNCPDAIVGIVGGGQHFDGTRGINVASDSSLNWRFDESFSFEFWMRKDIETIENEPVVGRVYESGQSQWWVGVGHNVGRGQARFFARDSAGNAFGVSGTTILTDGLWHHVVAVRDAVGSELRIYVDGVLEGITSTSYGSDFVAPNAPMTIGMVELVGATMDFNGSLDEVAVYNRALSLDEIDVHFNNGYLGLGYFVGGEYAPQITSTPPESVIVSQIYQYDVYAAGSPPPSFVLEYGPSGMVVNSVTGFLEWTPEATGTFSVKVVAQNAIGSDSQIFTITVQDSLTPSGDFESFMVDNVDDNWVTVNLAGMYTSPVVIASPNYDKSSPSLVVRIRNAVASSFEVRVVNVNNTAASITGVDVYFFVVEEGVYTEAVDGVTMEAVRYTSTVTDRQGSWIGQKRTYANSYVNPVVLGQVMTENDPDFSVFWSMGADRTAVPSSTSFYAGKHVGEDSDITRVDETIGYLVIEAGTYSLFGMDLLANLGPVSVSGVDNVPPYTYSINGMSGVNSVIVSQSSMLGGNGGWAMLYGATPFSDTQINLAIDEDQIKDSERIHGTEPIAYLVTSNVGNRAPVMNPIGDKTAIEGEQLQFNVTVSDPDGPAPLVLDASGTAITSGAVFTDSGIFTWTPEVGASSNSPYSVTFTATEDDGNGLFAEETISITVNERVVLPIESFMVNNVGGNWVTVNLAGTFTSPVVIASPNYDKTSSPLVVRIRNAFASSFEVRVVNVNNTAASITGVDIYFVVVEEGVYTQAVDGITMEAVRYTSTVTDRKGSWIGQQRNYANSYVNPVVLGQVMTENDPGFSVFWSMGSDRRAAPSSTAFFTGKHVGEDGDTTRNDETIGYVVIEAGNYSLSDMDMLAKLGPVSVAGVDNVPPYTYSINGITGVTSVIVSQSSMLGGNGGWAMLYGAIPFSDTQINLAVDEDQIKDSERSHTSEPIAYLAISNLGN